MLVWICIIFFGGIYLIYLLIIDEHMGCIKSLDKKKSDINNRFKKRTSIDLFDLGILIIFIAGILLSVHFYKLYNEVNFSDLTTVLVLWFTAIVIMSYTKETYHLKDITRKQYDLNRAPFVIMCYDRESPYQLWLKNLGKGIARNVQIKSINEHNIKEIENEKIIFPLQTVIPPNDGVHIMPDVPDKIKGDNRTSILYKEIAFVEPKRGIDLEIEINYENASGIKYKTILESSKYADEYYVNDYKKM